MIRIVSSSIAMGNNSMLVIRKNKIFNSNKFVLLSQTVFREKKVFKTTMAGKSLGTAIISA